MKNAVLIGSDSDIAKGIFPMLLKDGYSVDTWKRGGTPLGGAPWELVIVCLGRVAPVGNWWEQDDKEWEECFESNLFLPLRLLKSIWFARKPNATVIWMAGSNPNKIMDGYSAYNSAKMSLLKLVEQLDHETPDCKFVAFGPGYVKTKIHKATLDANWPNERIARGDDGNSMEDIYKAMMWCVQNPKWIVGGRNIAVSDVPLMTAPSDDAFKLRRAQ